MTICLRISQECERTNLHYLRSNVHRRGDAKNGTLGDWLAADTDCHAAPSHVRAELPRSARSRNSRAEFLKSAVEGSRTVRYISGRRNFSTLFDSRMTFSLPSSRWSRGRASLRPSGLARCAPITTRTAPATRNREVSDSPERSRSSGDCPRMVGGGAITGFAVRGTYTVAVLRDLDRSPIEFPQRGDQAGNHAGLADIASSARQRRSEPC